LRTPRRRRRAIVVVIILILILKMMERGGEFLGDSLKTQGSRRDKNKLLLLRLSEGVESGVKV